MLFQNMFQKSSLLSAMFIVVALASCAIPQEKTVLGGKPENAVNVCLSREHGIMALPEPVIVFTDSFTGSLRECWTAPMNHQNIVTFKTAKQNGKNAMFWINEQKEDEYDTETAIGSKPFSVKGLFQIDLNFNALSTVGNVLRDSIIHYGVYDFKICWYRANETVSFAEDYFDCATSPESYVKNTHVFVVPKDAASATLHFGFGKPNFQPGQFFAIADLAVKGYGQTGQKVSSNALFETAPMRLTGNEFSFEGNMPTGTAIAFSFSYAPDANGAPGNWSDWSSPVTEASALVPDEHSAWVKCKIILSSDGSAAASVRSLTIGETTETAWESFLRPASIDINRTSPSPARGTAPLVTAIQHKAELNWKTTVLKLDDKPAAFTQNHTDSTTVLSVEPETAFTDGVHTLSAHIETVDGGLLDRTLVFFVGEKPEGLSQITLRKDGMMLIDNKPFFPIGLYVLKKFDGNRNDFDIMFKQLRTAGFNFGREVGCFPTLEQAREFADAAERNDFKVFMTAGFHYANCQDLKTIAEGVAQLMDRKAILMWYIGDDTSAHNTPQMLKWKNDAVKSVDPTRITVQADGVGSPTDSNYAPFVNCTDAFHPEIYPIHIQDGASGHDECVRNVIKETDTCIQDIAKKSTGPRSIQALVQNFASRTKNKAAWDWPTAKEVRAMSYASVIRGATGMLWYMYGPLGGYHGIATVPERWEAQCKLAGEFNALYDILIAEPVQQPAEPAIIAGPGLDRKKRKPVYALLKTNATRTVLMTVNASVDDVTAQFTLPGYIRAKELFADGKTYPITSTATLDVSYKRHDVRIFELEK